MPPRLNSTPGYSSTVDLYREADSPGLTPRTPHSRLIANAEEGSSRRVGPIVPVNEANTEDEDDGNIDEIDLLQTQSHPLLHSSASEHFPIGGRSRWSSDTKGRRGWHLVKQRLLNDRLPIGLIVGCASAVLLLFLIVISVRRPEALLDYMGVNKTAIVYEALDDESKARFNGSTVIDFAASGYKSYPLTTDQYFSECVKVVQERHKGLYASYWEMVPGTELDVLHKKPMPSQNTCNSSITYLLDGSVGLMADLAHLAQVAMFSYERNRTLFVHDGRWNRGRWTDHFLPFSETQPGPEPGCAPPPPEELVSCPRTARHWVTSARLDYFNMDDRFEEEYEDPYKYTIERKKPIFDRSAQSFEEFIRPNAANQKFIQLAREELAELAVPKTNGEYISMHIRRGDCKAMSWRYQDVPGGQIPTAEYVDAVWKTYSHLENISDTSNVSPSSPPLVYLASDSSVAASEFTELLTTNDTLIEKYGNETLKAVVYQLRTSTDPELRSLAPAVEYVQSEWNTNRTEADRIRETRGVIVDWALLSGTWTPRPSDGLAEAEPDVRVKPEAVICGFTSNLCRLAAIGLGWNRSFDLAEFEPGPDRRWIEIDNHGAMAPMWKAFEIYN